VKEKAEEEVEEAEVERMRRKTLPRGSGEISWSPAPRGLWTSL
jgi:hypothetical protein